jgi:NitT/TauT family transport system substrate-binding protein
MSGYFATQSWAQQNPNTARAFQAFLLKAQAYAQANPTAVQDILPAYTKVTAAAASHIPVNSYPSTLDPAELQKVIALMKSGGLPTASLSPSSLLFH